MSRVAIHAEGGAKAAAGTTRVVQRRCNACGGRTRSSASCPECEKKKKRPLQTRLQMSTPGDAGEREAERAADDVMRGRTPTVQLRAPGALAQRQDAGVAPPVASDAPRDAGAPDAPAADAGTAGTGTGAPTTASATPTCTPTGFSRADYLTQPGTSVNDFGLTRLSIGSVTFPTVSTTRSRGRFRVDPTTAALPTIPSVFTQAGTFDEGTAHFIDQDGTSGCPSGRIPLRWLITSTGAAKIREGEQEHCSDFQLAFDLSLARYAAAVNAIAAAGTTFASQARAERAVQARVGVAPADWQTVFTCLAQKTLIRDRHNDHLPQPDRRPPRLADSCAFARIIVSDRSLRRVGQTSSASLVQGCGENGPTTGAGSRSGSATRGTSGEVRKPAWEDATWDTGDNSESDEQLLQRSALDTNTRDAPVQPDSTSRRDPVDAALASSGHPLDTASRDFMESRFQRDFSQVRIHTDAAAAASADALHAHAYTVGRDIVFNRGAYAPHSETGRHLLAHELTHVVQQQASTRPLLMPRVMAGRPTEPAPGEPASEGTAPTRAQVLEDYLRRLSNGGTPTVDRTSGEVRMDAEFCRQRGAGERFGSGFASGAERGARIGAYFLGVGAIPGALIGGLIGAFAGLAGSQSQAEDSSTPTGSTCLCDMVRSSNTWTVHLHNFPEPLNIQGSEIDQPLTSNLDNGAGFVVVPTPTSPRLYGAATVSGRLENYEPWLILGHELCGHAWLRDRQRGSGDEEGTNQSEHLRHHRTVERENRIRAEHGLEARGYRLRDPYCGESFHRPRDTPDAAPTFGAVYDERNRAAMRRDGFMLDHIDDTRLDECQQAREQFMPELARRYRVSERIP